MFMAEYFSKVFGISSLEELKSILNKPGRLDDELLGKSMEMAKRLAGEDMIYSLSENSRLDYVKKMMRDYGLREKVDVDSHEVAIAMQGIYGVNFGVNPNAAFEFLYHPFNDKPIELPDAKEVKLSKKEEKRIEKNFDKIVNEMFENMLFDTQLHEEFKDGVSKSYMSCLREAYLNKFGQPEKRGTYSQLLDQDILEFCRGVVKDETGISPPEIKILLDTRSLCPSIQNNNFNVPSIALQRKDWVVNSLLAELPHLVTKQKEADLKEFAKDRKTFFKKQAWHEGVPEVVREKGLAKLYEEAGIKNPGATAASAVNESHGRKGVMLEHVSNAFRRYMSDEEILGTVAYNSIAYPVGWRLARKLPKPDFVQLVSDPRAYESPKLGWNSQITGEDRTFINNELVMMKNATKAKYNGKVDSSIWRGAIKAVDMWAKDFLG
jgi:hypothetical protein